MINSVSSVTRAPLNSRAIRPIPEVAEHAGGITGVSRSSRAIWQVADMPEGMTGVYQLGFPLQLSPTEAGVSLNIRCSGVKAIDLEVGNDLLISDDLGGRRFKRIVPFGRAGKGINPKTGEAIVYSRYPINVGFVPLGARLDDGSPHPHAGTGFGIGQVQGFPADRLNMSDPFSGMAPEDMFYAIEISQCVYDGEEFKIVSSRFFDVSEILPGYRLGGCCMGPVYPDGAGLIMGLSGDTGDQIRGCGILRWQSANGTWKPVAFQSVVSDPGKFNTISGVTANFVEPSVIRLPDGRLLFTAREVGDIPFGKGPLEAERLQVWSSADDGASWKRIMEIPHFHPLTPLSISRAADGSPFILANGYCNHNSKGEQLNSMVLRESINIWPLNKDLSGLENPISVLDTAKDFGPPPHGSFWRIDHPVGFPLRQKDGKWHHFLFFRALEHNECDSDAPMTDHTGCYIEEVYSSGVPAPVWNF